MTDIIKIYPNGSGIIKTEDEDGRDDIRYATPDTIRLLQLINKGRNQVSVRL